MKQSTSQIFNTSEKSQNNSIRSIYSLLKNNTSTSKIKNNSLTCLNFPKLYSKLKYKRNKGNNDVRDKIYKYRKKAEFKYQYKKSFKNFSLHIFE